MASRIADADQNRLVFAFCFFEGFFSSGEPFLFFEIEILNPFRITMTWNRALVIHLYSIRGNGLQHDMSCLYLEGKYCV